MNEQRPLILIANDDGYKAKGINALADMLRPLADIVVCAPDGPRSGYSCAFSAELPLRLKLQHEDDGLQVWSCNGTPVDCVKMALGNIVSRRPDMVVGGINHGDNSSVNSHYSGTVGIVLEGCMKYIPSVAFSLCDFDEDADFEPLRPYVVAIARRVLSEGLPQGVCLNVNFPSPCQDVPSPFTHHPSPFTLHPSPYKGVRICRMARGRWVNETTKCHHKRGYDYWWMVGNYVSDEPEADDTDRWALNHGYVAITPTRIDVTAYEAMEQLKGWNIDN